MTYSRTYPREPAKSGDEMEAVSKRRLIHGYLKHACSKVKRKIRRRERRNLNSHNEG
jgi:hypothetical protein